MDSAILIQVKRSKLNRKPDARLDLTVPSASVVSRLSAQRGCGTYFPFLQHSLSNLGKTWALLDVGADFFRGFENRIVDALQNLPDLRGCAAHTRFAEPAQILRAWPFCRAVEGEG